MTTGKVKLGPPVPIEEWVPPKWWLEEEEQRVRTFVRKAVERRCDQFILDSLPLPGEEA